MIVKGLQRMLVLSAVLIGSPAMAQVGAPAAGAAAAPAAAGPVAAPPAAAAAGPGFLQKCCDALDACRRKMCAAPCGQMLNSMTMPLSTMTGGIIPSFCPQMPSAKDLAQPGAAGAADNAKKDALEAKARREAVRYLGTLDCRYYPEAEAALIAALRGDRVECVRLEAAIAFANGCCCTRRVMEALEICVSGSDRDGNPSERSERVRDFAYIALNRCVSCFHDTTAVETEEKKIQEKPPERIEEAPKPNVTKVDKVLIERSRKTIALYQAKREASQAAIAHQTVLPKGDRSLLHIIKYAAEGPPQTQQAQQSQPVQQRQPVMMPASRVVNQTVAPPELNSQPRELPDVKSPPMQGLPEAAPQPRELQDMPLPQTQAAPAAAPISVEQVESSPAGTPAATQPSPDGLLRPTASAPAPAETKAATATESAPTSQETPGQPVSVGVAAQSSVTVSGSNNEHPTESGMPAASVSGPGVEPATAAVSKPKSVEETVNGQVDQLMANSVPLKRHEAIRDLASNDWRKYPQVLAAFVKAARLDSDRAVRVNAIRHLALLKMDIPYVLEHLKYMQKDRDEWVAQESKEALAKLTAAPNGE